MQYTPLGRTGLTVSVAGLGCGGNSRIGLGTLTEARSIALVHEAMDLGVNFIDTAMIYGTEEIVGKAVRGRRDRVVISTKSYIADAGRPLSGADVVANLEGSLQRLGTDYVDVFHLHGLLPSAYDRAMAEIVPALQAAQAQGKVRHLAVSESSPRDPEHTMLARAVEDDVWAVIMVGFHMLGQTARRPVLERSIANKVGTLCMFAVRNIFSRPGLLRETVAGLVAEGKLPAELAREDDPLGFLIHAAGAENLTDGAYRFARHEPGMDVVLFGTSRPEHLRANIRSILRPPLPAADVAQVRALFGHLVGVGFDLPDRVQNPPA